VIVAVVCTALLGVLVFGLGLGVSLTRGRTGVIAGCPDDPDHALTRMSRAHGNTTEYAPMLAVLMLVVGANDPPAWALWTMGLAVACRYVFVVGVLVCPTMTKPHPLRFIGASGTYAAGLALCVAALATL
jgi:uncharacterized membrane protein YecN with MAPEG domain